MKARRIDFSPDEWLAAVAGMPADTQGLYWLICSLIYSSGSEDGGIEENDPRLAPLSGCHWRRRAAIIADLIKQGKLVKIGSRLCQERCKTELQTSHKRMQDARMAASKRWNNNAIDDAAASGGAYANHQPSTTIVDSQTVAEVSETPTSARVAPLGEPQSSETVGQQVALSADAPKSRRKPVGERTPSAAIGVADPPVYATQRPLNAPPEASQRPNRQRATHNGLHHDPGGTAWPTQTEPDVPSDKRCKYGPDEFRGDAFWPDGPVVPYDWRDEGATRRWPGVDRTLRREWADREAWAFSAFYAFGRGTGVKRKDWHASFVQQWMGRVRDPPATSGAAGLPGFA